MANVGTATLTITPKLTGLKQAVETQLQGVSPEAATTLGNSIGTNIAGGFNKAGIAAGVFAQITSTVMGQVSSHISSAISRFDTLNNYPTVMENLGYSADVAQASVAKISDRLQTLPTTLDSMVSVVQGLTATVGDLNKATDLGLALNDMLLAAGASTEQVSGAMEQFRRIVAKGKPDMLSWQIIATAMPGQMKQLAEEMLGAGHNADELYTALGGGGAKATISLDQLMQKMIEMDSTSTDTFHSFQEQAEIAAGGVQTSMENMGNAITRGITSVMDTIGKENIAGAFDTLKSVINSVFKDVSSGVAVIKPTVEAVGGLFKDLMPILTKAAEGFVLVKGSMFAFNGISSIFQSIKTAGTGALNTITKLGSAFKIAQQTSLATSAGLKEVMADATMSTKHFSATLTELGGNSIGILGKVKAFGSGLKGVFSSLASNGVILAGISLAISAVGTAIADAVEKHKTFTKATDGLKKAAENAASLNTIGERYKRLGTSAIAASKSVEDLTQTFATSVDTMNEKVSEVSASINEYQRAQDIVSQYAGSSVDSIKNDAVAYGDVTWALSFLNDKLGTNISLQDVANNSYKDAQGHVQNLTSKIYELTEAKKEQAKQDALQGMMTDAYKDLYEAQNTYTGLEQSVKNKESELAEASKSKGAYPNGNSYTQALAINIWEEKQKLEEAGKLVDSAQDRINKLSGALGDAASQYDVYTTSLATLESKMGSKTEAAFSALQKASGKTKEDFVKDLQAMGVSVQNLGDISDTELAEIVSAYDGSEESIQNVANKITEYLARSGDAVVLWRDAFAEMSISFDDLARSFGITVEELSLQFAQAGIHAEDMQHISSQAFDGLREAAGGDIESLIFLIQEYNNEEMWEKSAEVDPTNAEQNTDWAKQKLQEWNDKSVEEKTARVNVEGKSALDGLISSLETFGKLAGGAIHATVSGFVSGLTGNAEGGIKTHADGAIVNMPSKGVPLDIVGEDGAEAIVPLTNRKYAMPFVKMIAGEIATMLGDTKERTTQNFTINANDPNLVAAVVAQKQRMALS